MKSTTKYSVLFLVITLCVSSLIAACTQESQNPVANTPTIPVTNAVNPSPAASPSSAVLPTAVSGQTPTPNAANTLKLYWFIPDGLRAEPDLFNIYEWAQAGELPNIAKLMEQGAYGYSIPDYPSHTPVNFASLLTGVHPDVHGVADGPMHVEGHSLNQVSVGGFRSGAKKVDPAWITFEQQGLSSALLSMPGSTPPEINDGLVVRGRWGGWGADFHAVNFQDETDDLPEALRSKGVQLFFNGPKLHHNIAATESAVDFGDQLSSESPIKQIELSSWGATVYGFMYDSTADDTVNYDHIAFSLDQTEIVADLTKGDWSDWLPIELTWTNSQGEAITVATQFKIKIIRLTDDGKFRVRLFYNNINQHVTEPSSVADEIVENVGPMVDFVDNFPPQLIYFDEDKEAFMEEATMSFDWHTKLIPFVTSQYAPDVVLHDIYTPNQMLTSRWWMGYIDPRSARYNDITEEEREQLWAEVKAMYKQIDTMIGKIMASADENTYIVLSSDHGAAPLNKRVALNNYFAQNGLLSIKYNEEKGFHDIDWENTKVAFLRMNSIYIDPNGLGGDWKRASGPEYEKLRDEVIELLNKLNSNGETPVANVVKWEDAEEFLDLPADRVGDLIISNELGYGWREEVSEDMEVFIVPLKTGYKQAIDPQEKAMWTPFIIAGPGVKANHEIRDPISHVDQLPTIIELMDLDKPDHQFDGQVLEEIIK
ncbi:MAG: alkaline phosphatase family protein [Chloroflexales bacterium]|nr:alkaline phosphatase family protein [Chloroflexales bacterium]